MGVCVVRVELTTALYDSGYQYMLDPDHAPDHPNDPDLSPKQAVAKVSQCALPSLIDRLTFGKSFVGLASPCL